MTRAERRELADLQRQYPQQWLIPREAQERYYVLFAKEEQDYAREVAREWTWHRRKPALQTWADVLFWCCAVPLWVVMAIDGAWGQGTVLVGLLWLGLRCQWTLVDRWLDRGRNASVQRKDA